MDVNYLLKIREKLHKEQMQIAMSIKYFTHTHSYFFPVPVTVLEFQGFYFHSEDVF